MPELLEFEEPVGVLLKEIEALSMLPKTPEREKSIESLRRRADEIRVELFKNLTPWQRVLVSRHPNRPNTLDYVERLFTDVDELHGDRRFADDHAIVTGLGGYKGQPVAFIGHQKGRDTKQKIFRNFGYARPEGYRKAMRVMQMAQKFSRPIVVFIDTPAAYPGMESEERGVAEAIAVNLREMMMIEVPIIVIVCGEGGSGGALGIAIGDRVMMQEFSVYSVIPPEGCAAILWRDANKKVEAATALKITASDMVALGLVDDIIPEPSGGAHNDYDAAAALVDQALSDALADSARMSAAERLDARYAKFRRMGEEGTSFTDTGADRSTTPDLLARRSPGEGGKAGPTGR
jgi:acetyl-CoA carboxylase carboxyl transferase subunit alpha